MKIIFLIISCIISCELTFWLHFKSEFYSIKENLKNYIKQFKNLNESNDNPFKILIEIFLDYSKVVFKFLIILFPIIIYLIISILLKIDILEIFMSLKINFLIISSILIYIYLRKKIVRK